MNKPFRHRSDASRAELLAGFADGELPCAERLEIEDWLSRDPEAAAAAADQRHVAHLYRDDPVVEPDETVWAKVLTRIEAGLAPAAPTLATAEPRIAISHARAAAWSRGALRWAGAAAALWLLLTVNPIASYRPPAAAAIEPLPVMASEDVDMLTVHGADSDRLVVGAPLQLSSIDWAGPDDVLVDSMQPDADGMVPYVRVQSENPGPMVVAPLGDGPRK